MKFGEIGDVELLMDRWTNEPVITKAHIESMAQVSYCRFRNFRQGFIFAKLRICEVS